MYRLRKILSILLLFVMVLSFVPEGSLVFDFKAKAANYNWNTSFSWSSFDKTSQSDYLKGKPGVYIMGDGYAIIWVTTFNGMGSVTYKGEGGEEITIYDQRNGITRTNDTIHVVKIGLDQLQYLQKDGYFIRSENVENHSFAETNHGELSVVAGPIKVVETPSTSSTSMSILALTDIHGDSANAKKVADLFIQNRGEPDIAVFPGDISGNGINYKSEIEATFEIMGNITQGRIPTVYVRGNHECRGVVSTLLLDYLPTKTGQFYFDFEYGPLWGVVIDTAEDKSDDHQYYGGLANFERYLIEEQKWLRSLPKNTSAKFRMGVYHTPALGSYTPYGYSVANPSDIASNKVDLTDSIHHLGLDFALAGHNHTAVPMYRINNVAHDTYVCGGHVGTNFVGTWVDVKDSKALASSVKDTGEVFRRSAPPLVGHGSDATTTMTDIQLIYPANRTSAQKRKFSNRLSNDGYNGIFASYQDSDSGLSPSNANLSVTDFKVGGSYLSPEAKTSGTNISIAAQPTVFETGGDWYNIVWVSDNDVYTTSTNGGSTWGVTGFVQYEYNGVTYQIFDEVAGYRRAYDNIHTVKIPKEHLNNNKYMVVSLSVGITYTTDGQIYYQMGNYYAASKQYLFQDRSSDKTPNILNYGDLKYPTNDFYGYADEAVDNLGTSPTVVVVSGNAVQTTTGNKLPSANELANGYSFSSITGMIVNDPMAYGNLNLHTSENYNMLPWIFKATADVSDSIHPVIFSRGYTECRGMFATELYKYIPTVTGEFHYTVNYGDFTYVNMDTNEDEPTDAKVTGSTEKKYCERIDPDQIKRDLDAWMFGEKGVFATGKTDNGEDLKEKLIVITNQPLYHIDKRDTQNGTFANLLDESGLGPQWAKRLKQNGAIINITSIRYTVSAPDSLSNVDTNVHERQMFTVCNGAYAHTGVEPTLNNTTVTIYSSATSILVSEDSAYVTNCIYKGIKNNYTTYSSAGVYQRTEGAYSLVSGEQLSSYDDGTETKNIKSSKPDNNGTTYYLSTPSHLIWLSEQVHNGTTYSGSTFELVNDIDLMLIPFTPIGGYNLTATGDNYTGSAKFSGKFDGKGYKIKNLHILPSVHQNVAALSDDIESCVGLFGAVQDATIIDLTVEGGLVKGGHNIGGLIGNAQSSTTDSNVTKTSVENCYSNVIVFAPGGNDVGGHRVGGLIGSTYCNVMINQCANYGNVFGSRTNASYGGIVGMSYNSNKSGSTYTAFGVTEIYNSYNRGNIISFNPHSVSENITMSSNAGGILGRSFRANLKIHNCYNAASIWGENFKGALFSWVEGVPDTNATLQLQNCYFSEGYNGATTASAAGQAHIEINNTWYSLYADYLVKDRSGVIPSTWQNTTSYNAKSVSTMTSSTFYSTLDSNAYVADNGTRTYEGSTKKYGIINDGYPIHAHLKIHAPEHVITKEETFSGNYNAEQDAFDKADAVKVNGTIKNNVNTKFSNGTSNITGVSSLSNTNTMYVLVSNGTDYLYATSSSAASYKSLTAYDAKRYVWKLTKNSTGSNYTLESAQTPGRYYTGSKLSTTSSSLNLSDVTILPLLQDNVSTTYGFTGTVDGGISSVISSLSVENAHVAIRDAGLCDMNYNSVYGNNIFYSGSSSAVVLDTLSLAYRQTTAPTKQAGSYMTAPDATGQLMDMACDDNFAWEISPSNAANKALNYNSNNSSFTFADDSNSNAQRFFIAYSFNADGGYYLIPVSSGKVITVSDSGTTTHSLTTETVADATSASRFWIYPERKPIRAEVVDVLVRFDRDGKVMSDTGTGNEGPYKYVEVREETRFYNELYFDSMAYNPDGFWTDLYSNVNGTKYVYAFDSIDVISPENIVVYRYFRPIVVHVTYTSNLPETAKVDRMDGIADVAALEQINLDTQGRPTRYYYDGALNQFGDIDVTESKDGPVLFTDSFNVTYNLNGGTKAVDPKTYQYTLDSWYFAEQSELAAKDNIGLEDSLDTFITTSKGDHFEVTLLAKWSSAEMPHDKTDGRELHVFYGWNRPTATKTLPQTDEDIETAVPGCDATCEISKYPLRKDAVANAYWVGADFSGTTDKRTDHTQNISNDSDKLIAVAALYGEGTTAVQGDFANLKAKSSFNWTQEKADGTSTERTERVEGTWLSKYQPNDLIAVGAEDRGSAIKAQFVYDSTIITGAYAYSALIPTDTLVDGIEETATNKPEAEWFSKKYVTGTFVKGANEFEIAYECIISGGFKTNNNVTDFKVYGIWTRDGNEDRVLVVDNGLNVMDIDGGVSYRGVMFEKYIVVFTLSKATTLAKGDLVIKVHPRIYRLVLNNKNASIDADVEYVGNKSDKNQIEITDTHKFVDGQRAWQKSNNRIYFYQYDIIRLKIPTPDDNKLAAGTYFTVKGINGSSTTTYKVFPTYSTTSTLNAVYDKDTTDDNVYVPLLNGLDVLLKNETERYIVFANKTMTINVYPSYSDNSSKDDPELYQNINIGPLGAKIETNGTKKIRFGIVWYLDDVVTENRWYRVHTDPDNGPTFGGYLIPLDNLMAINNDSNDFYLYMKAKHSAYDTRSEFKTLSDKDKLAYLNEFIAYWNSNANVSKEDDNDATGIKFYNRKMSFGQYTASNGELIKVAGEVGAFMYYYHPGEMNEETGVREAVVEYSVLLDIPEGREDTKVVYIPYASYVYGWHLGTMAPQPPYPDNVYIYSAPEKAYTYNEIYNEINSSRIETIY